MYVWAKPVGHSKKIIIMEIKYTTFYMCEKPLRAMLCKCCWGRLDAWKWWERAREGSVYRTWCTLNWKRCSVSMCTMSTLVTR